MNNLTLFESPKFGQVRTVTFEDKPYFVANDIAKALGYAETAKAIRTHCKGVSEMDIPSKGGVQKMKIIPEGDIYRLVIKSQLPAAEKFEAWVFDEVLPAIRKHGAYMTPQTIEEVLLNPDTIIQLAQNLKAEQEHRKQLQSQIEQDKPKVIFADAVSTAKTSILVGELAKLLKQNGIDIGQNRLFEWLRSKGYLIKRKGTDYNMPTQKSMEMKLFEVKETSIARSDGHIDISKTSKVTGKGQQYFINLFLQEKAS